MVDVFHAEEAGGGFPICLPTCFDLFLKKLTSVNWLIALHTY